MELRDNTHLLGASGQGKTTLLEAMAIQSIEAGNGAFLLDPHGSMIDTVLNYIPPRRRRDTVLFDPSQFWLGFNELHAVPPDLRPNVAAAYLAGIKDAYQFADSSTAVMDDLIRHAFLAILETPDPSILGLKYMLTSQSYREYVLRHVKDSFIKDYWEHFETIKTADRDRKIESSLNKAHAFTADYRLRCTFGQTVPSFTMSDILKDKVLLCRLPQGRLGVQETRLTGMMMLSLFHVAALRREEPNPFDLFIRDVHHFQGFAVREMLSGVQKYGVALHVSNSALDQFTAPGMREAVLANTPTRYVFNISRKDTEELETEMPVNNSRQRFFELPPNVAKLGDDSVYIKGHPPSLYPGAAAKTIKHTRTHYSRSQKAVEEDVNRFLRHT